MLRGIVSRGSAAGIRGRYVKQDTTGLNGEDGVSGLSEGLQVDVQAAVDLPDARTGGFTVYNQDFAGALREEHSRKRQDQSQIKNDSKRRVLAHHRTPRFLGGSEYCTSTGFFKTCRLHFRCPHFFCAC